MELISVERASHLVQSKIHSFGEEQISFQMAKGRVLAEDIHADRDFPPFDRVTMDGFAIRSEDYRQGVRQFQVSGVQYAGEAAGKLLMAGEVMEVMTGTPLPEGCDSVVPIEVCVTEGSALTLPEGLEMERNIHPRGSDRQAGDVILAAGRYLKAPDLAVLATVGKVQVQVKKRPAVAIITSGDELVGVTEQPQTHQIRKSNVYAISACIGSFCERVEHFHLPDDLPVTVARLRELLQTFDVLILSGGVSAGKKDYMPLALEELGVQKVFHKIQQRPGKPIWFGQKEQKTVFALPGNPVSAFMCAVRYVKPWLQGCGDIDPKPEYAILNEEILFKPRLGYFMQVRLLNEGGRLLAIPCEGHGSGDLANLSDAEAFLELPMRETDSYEKGEVFRVWRY